MIQLRQIATVIDPAGVCIARFIQCYLMYEAEGRGHRQVRTCLRLYVTKSSVKEPKAPRVLSYSFMDIPLQ
jgi:hypothetical protein